MIAAARGNLFPPDIGSVASVRDQRLESRYVCRAGHKIENEQGGTHIAEGETTANHHKEAKSVMFLLPIVTFNPCSFMNLIDSKKSDGL